MDDLLGWDYAPTPPPPEIGTRQLDFDGALEPPLHIEQDGGAAGCGGKLWPAGDLLSRYVLKLPLKGVQKVLELGCGTGLAGLALALGHPEIPKVYITDLASMVPLMKRNVKANRLNSRVCAAELRWGEPLPSWSRDPDLILAADCIYLEEAFPLLERTLLDLTEKGPVPILIAYKRRRKADKRFFKAIRHNFKVVELDAGEEFRRDSVFLFRLERYRHSN